MKFYFIIILIITFSNTNAQNFPYGIDSVDTKLNQLKGDTEKINYIIKITDWHIKELDIIPYLLIAIKKAEILKSDTLLAELYSNLAIVHYQNTNFNKSIYYRNKSEIYYKNINNYKKLRESYRDKSRSYFYLGQYDFAIYEVKKALQLSSKASKTGFKSQLYREIGISYIRLNQVDSALYYYKKALEISLKYNLKTEKLYNYSEIGKYHFEKGNNLKAIMYQKKAIKSAEDKASKYNTQLPFLRLSQAYFNINELDSSMFYGKLCIKDFFYFSTLDAYRVISNIYFKKNKIKKALAYADSCNYLSLKMKNINQLNEDYLLYSKIYQQSGNRKMHLYYKDLQLANYDTIIIQANKQKVQNIKILTDIDNIKASNNSLLEEKKQDEIKLRSSKIINIASGIIIILSFMSIFAILFFMKRLKTITKKVIVQKNEIHSQNEEITAQNEEITAQNEEISSQNEEISSQNDLLHDKNDTLSETIEKLNQTKKQLVHSEKMASLGILTAGIAHEINNPINFVYAGVNSVLQDFKDIDIILEKINNLTFQTKNTDNEILNIIKLKEEISFDEAYFGIKEILIDIKIGAERTSEIVLGLRDFSRIDTNDWTLSNIHELIDSSLLILQNKYKYKIELTKNYSENVKNINCIPGKLRQVFVNIITNSIDAIENEGTIIITTSQENNKIIISVKDNGIGISEEVRKNIFDPFFTTKSVGKGTGLGLSISYGIIEEHKGKIKLISEEGKGTEFIIILKTNLLKQKNGRKKV